MGKSVSFLLLSLMILMAYTYLLGISKDLNQDTNYLEYVIIGN